MARMPPHKKRKVGYAMARRLDPSGRLSDYDIDIQIKRLDDAAFKKKNRKKALWT